MAARMHGGKMNVAQKASNGTDIVSVRGGFNFAIGWDKIINCGVGLMGDCGGFRCAELRHEKGACGFFFHTY
ncbi:hypothetical protein NXY34_07080 [Bacteroides fragilis]|nr:hypothetical protein [Bacteroides fragilis]